VKYLRCKKFGKPAPDKIVLHHTWKPTIQAWNGEETIQSLKKHYESRGWSAGPHIFIADDGIWLFTDMKEVGIHAGLGNATWKKEGKLYGGYKCERGKLQGYSIGVEVVGNYDEKVWEGETLKNALFCISELQKKLGISIRNIMFHQDYSQKSCPGNAITREWFKKKLAAFKSGKKITHEYVFQFSPEEAKKAINLGFLEQVDSEMREIVAIGLVRVYEKIKKEMKN